MEESRPIPVLDEPPVGRVAGKELVLDTKGTCFLCLTEASTVTNGMTEACLRNICRYLKINPCSIVLESLKGGALSKNEEEEVSSQNVKCDFTVMLCETCANLATNLSQLICQMELIKILIAYQLRVFHQIVSASDHDKESHLLWKKFQEKMMTSEADPVEARLVETLRHETKEKCSRKLTTLMEASVPKVSMRPLNPANNLSPNDQRRSSWDPVQKDASSALESSASIIMTPKQPLLAGRSMKSSNSAKFSDILHFGKICTKLIHKDDTGNYNLCTVCDRKFPPSHKKACGHLLAAHPEVFFVHRPEVPDYLAADDKFKARCQLLLRTLKNQAKQVRPSEGSMKIRVYSCLFCNRKSVDGSTFKSHLLMEHYSILEQKLSHDFPEVGTPSIISISKKISNPVKVRRVQWICSVAGGGCGRAFGLRWSLTRHKKDFCPNRKMKRSWPCHVAVGGCGKIFSSHPGFLRHKQESCPQIRKRKIWTCAVEDGGCGRKFLYKFSLIRHLRMSCNNRNVEAISGY